MGYLLKADDDGHYTVEIADGVWMDAIQMASEHGYSDPNLRRERGDDPYLLKAAAKQLADALNRALVAQHIEPEFGGGSALTRTSLAASSTSCRSPSGKVGSFSWFARPVERKATTNEGHRGVGC